MAKIIVEKWQCDRCKTVFDKKPSIGYPRVTLKYSISWEWSGGVTKWDDLCPECNDKIYKVLEEDFFGQS